MLEAVCPNGHRLQIPPEHAGMKLRCPAPGCGAVFQLAGAPAGGAPAAGASGLNLAPASTPAPQPQAASAPPPMNNPPPQPAAEAQGGRWTGSDPAQAAAGQGQAPRVSINPMKGNPMSGSNMKNIAQIAMMAGLVLALVSRGCDDLGSMDKERLAAKARLLANSATRDFENERDDLNIERANPDTKSDRKKEIDDRIKDLEKDIKDAIEENRVPARDLKDAAEDAGDSNTVWRYWRGWLSMLATVAFTLGLLGMMFYSTGVERYLCFGLLLIVVMTLYGGRIGISAGG